MSFLRRRVMNVKNVRPMVKPMPLVVVESPYAGKSRLIWPLSIIEKWIDQRRNVRYLRAAMADCFRRGEAPYASHGLYTQRGVLRDHLPNERETGIRAGFAWGRKAPKRVFYLDRGFSTGMYYGRAEAERYGQEIEYRTLPE